MMLMRSTKNSIRLVSHAMSFPTRNKTVHRLYSTTKPTEEKLALVIGSSGALGSTIVSHLQGSESNVTVIGADVNFKQEVDVDAFIKINGGCVDTAASDLENGFYDLFDSKPEFDLIVCANGGFAMDSDVRSGKMMEMNYNPVSAVCSEKVLPFIVPDHGLFIAFGATAASVPLDDDSPMKEYIKSKYEVHRQIQRLGFMTGKALKKSKGMHVLEARKRFRCLHELTAIAILPSTLDTELNRKTMKPSEDQLSEWTNLEDVANEIVTWMTMEDLRPHSGSFVKCVTVKGVTSFILTSGGL